MYIDREGEGESIGPHCSTSRPSGCGYFADSRGYSKSAPGLTVHVNTRAPHRLVPSPIGPLPLQWHPLIPLSPTYSAILQYARVAAVPSPSHHPPNPPHSGGRVPFPPTPPPPRSGWIPTLSHPPNPSLRLQFPPSLQGLRVRVDNSYPTANPLREAQVL
jgi:hypothetical protein